MARAVSSGTIAFGMVSIPVKIYSATESGSTISFRQLHDECRQPIKQKYHCVSCDEDLEYSALVKGYEFAKGQYVAFSQEELEAIKNVESDKTLQIEEFVPQDAVPEVYYDRTYYVGPDKGGAKAYALLTKALQEAELQAVARYASRGKQYVVLFAPMGNGLAMHQLYYADQIRPFSYIGVDDVEVGTAEVELAVQLVNAQKADSYDPEKYEDTVRWRIMGMIEKKLAGEEIPLVEAKDETPTTDLLATLQASLDAQGGRKQPKQAAQVKKQKKGRKTA